MRRAQTTPSRFTTLAHMSRLNPPLLAARAALNALSSESWFGRPAHGPLIPAVPLRSVSESLAGVDAAPSATTTEKAGRIDRRFTVFIASLLTSVERMKAARGADRVTRQPERRAEFLLRIVQCRCRCGSGLRAIGVGGRNVTEHALQIVDQRNLLFIREALQKQPFAIAHHARDAPAQVFTGW